MPGKFVFPGGRLDYVDQRLRVPVEIQAPVMERLRRHTQARTSDAKLRGLALAAVRETFEETGLVLGTPSKTKVLTRLDRTKLRELYTRRLSPIWPAHYSDVLGWHTPYAAHGVLRLRMEDQDG